MTTAPDELVPPSTDKTPAELEYGGGWKMVIPFALLPLLIVTASVGVFYFFGHLAEGGSRPEAVLQNLHSTSSHKRWQAAYELAGYLSQGKNVDRPVFEKELLALLQSSPSEEVRFRQYLIVGLGQVGSDKSYAPLANIASSPKAEGETRMYALLALAKLKAPQSFGLARAAIASDDPGFRKAGAFVLGRLGADQDIPALQRLLADPIPDVRWNAALALAALNDPAGQMILLTLLQPATVEKETPGLRDHERDRIYLSAVQAVHQLKLSSAETPLRKLAAQASDTRVRGAAREAADALAKL